MLTRSVAIALLFCAVGASEAQSPEDSVRNVVQAALDQLTNRDSSATSRLFVPGASLVLVSYSGDSTVLRSIPIVAIVASFTTGPQRREELRNPAVTLRGDLATVSGSYTFYFDATLHHCGDAMYDLIRSQGRWRITAIRQSDHRTGC